MGATGPWVPENDAALKPDGSTLVSVRVDLLGSSPPGLPVRRESAQSQIANRNSALQTSLFFRGSPLTSIRPLGEVYHPGLGILAQRFLR